MKRSVVILFFTILLVLPIVLMASQTLEPSKSEMVSHVPFRPLTIEELERFHGHVGPAAALGARMGEHAITTGNIPRYFGLTVLVECPAAPPGSCLIDGLQMATGATMGKKNILHTPAEAVKVTISDDKSGKKYVYTLKPATQALLKRWSEEKPDVEERGKKLFQMKAEELFNIES